MDKPPEQVEVDGKLYKINSDFRTSIQFEILMQKKELTEKQKEFANELWLLDKEMDRETAELLAPKCTRDPTIRERIIRYGLSLIHI